MRLRAVCGHLRTPEKSALPYCLRRVGASLRHWKTRIPPSNPCVAREFG
ncbi:hypothetical protein SCH4B_2307 [Ruegeria sp. TrichCH4B]|nr:hypothetical protein SCH4B_2307 [Ruegeria sp. TrichCH4B]